MKAMSLKNMKETLINQSGDTKEFDKIWDCFYLMQTLGYIDKETWNDFCEQCAGWYVDEENWRVMDGKHQSHGVASLVWDYAQGQKYED